MSRVRQLPPDIANQIAAGEVIERPANAVKELVENALDAGAKRVEIEIEEGGKSLIRVRDDGFGMSSQDAVLCLQRHATSKLQTTEDLYAIRTLGFRGEALPSIAAVSRFELVTREADAEAATKIVVDAGVIQDVGETAAPQGTEITVRNLFFNTPARFKFLKSDSAEAARINEMVGHLALAYPSVSFRLRHNNNELLRAEAIGENANPLNAVVSVLGRDTARQMLPIDTNIDTTSTREGAANDVRVWGFAGRPQLTRSNRNLQLFFVNGRVIKNRSLQHAVLAAYEGLIHGRDRFPITVIFLQMAPGSVDVNVHPTKSEVRFAREWEVHHAVRVALRETLVSSQLAPDWGMNGTTAPVAGGVMPEAGFGAPSPDAASNTRFAPSRYDNFHQPVAPRGGDIGAFRQAQQNIRNAPSYDFEYSPPVARPQQPDSAQPAFPDFAQPQPEDERKVTLKPLAQISDNAYILCEGSDGLYIVCQHRAHERILADRAIEKAEGRPVESQRLVIPFTSDVGPRSLAALEENASLLQDLGFEVEAFGGNSVLVRAVPVLVAKGDYETAFADLMDELVSGHGGRSLQERRRAMLTMLSCKNAIKAGDPLQMPQMQNLIDDLMTLPNPSICPHGQPILIKISTLELDKKFEREYASRS